MALLTPGPDGPFLTCALFCVATLRTAEIVGALSWPSVDSRNARVQNQDWPESSDGRLWELSYVAPFETKPSPPLSVRSSNGLAAASSAT